MLEPTIKTIRTDPVDTSGAAGFAAPSMFEVGRGVDPTRRPGRRIRWLIPDAIPPSRTMIT
ncbi:MAG: hypothetical protein CMJ54_10075 [Planctomycetaceae bacterium]|nr:hypothetical protein [Planctomycetaceae bacterium]